MSLAVVAQVCRYADALRILDRSSMEGWAIAMLGDDGTPSVLAEIATSRRLDASSVARLLDEVPGERNDERAAQWLLGAIGIAYLDDRIGMRRACSLARDLAFAGPLEDRVRYEIDAIDDGMALADDEDVADRLRAFFDPWMSDAAELPIRLTF